MFSTSSAREEYTLRTYRPLGTWGAQISNTLSPSSKSPQSNWGEVCKQILRPRGKSRARNIHWTVENRTLGMIVLMQRWDWCEISPSSLVILISMLKIDSFYYQEVCSLQPDTFKKTQCINMVFKHF